MNGTGRIRLRAALARFVAEGGALVGEAVGVHGVTEGLTEGIVRTPLSEAAAVGVGAGLALAGRRVIVELVDPAGLARAADVLADLAGMRARSSGSFAAPIVVRVPFSAFTPAGLPVAVAATAGDLVGLLGHALAAADPVVLMETDAALDGSEDGDGPVPGLGVPVVRRGGDGATVLAVGPAVPAALAATEGLDVEVVDLRALSPLDAAAIGARVRRTGRAVVIGAPDAALVALREAFLTLESPLLALPASADVPAVAEAVRATLAY